MFNIVLLGLPGSGKGTQASEISKKFGFDLVSVGDLLRKECKKDTEIGKKIKSRIDSGNLVDLDIISELVMQNIQESNHGVIFDGIPRSFEQAEILESMMSDLGLKIDLAIELNISQQAIIDRLQKRYVCNVCGAILCLSDDDKNCSECGSISVSKRDDDVCHESVLNRINTYNESLAVIRDFYSKQGVFHSINADQKEDVVFGIIEELITNKS